MSNNERFLETFREEARELLEAIESDIIALEEEGEEGVSESLQSLFRHVHTLKGNSGMFDLDHILEFAHNWENTLDILRNTNKVPGGIISEFLHAKDHLEVLLGVPEGNEELSALSEIIINDINSFVPPELLQGEKEGAVVQEPHPLEKIFRIRFRFPEDAFKRGIKLLPILDELSELGTLTVIPQTHELPEFNSLDPENSYLGWHVLINTRAEKEELDEVFLFVQDISNLIIEIITEVDDDDEEVQQKKLGEILLETGAVNQESLETALARQKPVGEILIEEHKVDPEALNTALKEQNHLKKTQVEFVQKHKQSSLRVDAKKLDQILNLVGELVTVNARLVRKSETIYDGELQQISEVFNRLVVELRDLSMDIRMVPLQATFNRLRRLVRDLMKSLGKDAEFVIEGEQTELDKSVIEKILDPLVHILRNSLDHGLESPAERENLGKPPKGTLKLSADTSGTSVFIRVEDDGQGLDPERIRKKAIERNLIDESEHLTDSDLFKLIFEPGFSTANKVTNVSGRGVGMDVVKKQMDLLRGKVSIDSKPGKFTRVTLEIPLTVAIIEGLLVKIESDFYVIPLYSVEACLAFEETMVRKNHSLFKYRDHIVPYLDLREFFGIEGEKGEYPQIVIGKVEQSHLGLVVDKVIGSLQVVIKSLGPLYREAQGVSGATILGSGRVALILDLPVLYEVQKRQAVVT